MSHLYAYPKRSGRGCALIIGNSFMSEKFDKQHWREPACTKDLENMANLWQNSFQCDLFKGQPHKDQSAANMRELLQKMANEDKNYEYIVIAISTHGGCISFGETDAKRDVECIVGNDGVPISLRKLFGFFRNDEAKYLQGIPKLFILQHCRGQLIDKGVLRDSTDTPDPEPDWYYEEPSLMPTYSDVCTIYATQASYKAFKDENGSWLFNFVRQVFQVHAQTEHVVDMLTIVNNRIKSYVGESGGCYVKTMSVVESTLTRKLYLTPRDVVSREEEPIFSQEHSEVMTT